MRGPRSLSIYLILLSELAGLVLAPSLPVQLYLLHLENDLLQPCKSHLLSGAQRHKLPQLRRTVSFLQEISMSAFMCLPRPWKADCRRKSTIQSHVCCPVVKAIELTGFISRYTKGNETLGRDAVKS
ncbi:uncharacterized protein VSU04_002259 [Chlamydotis macqueenii]